MRKRLNEKYMKTKRELRNGQRNRESVIIVHRERRDVGLIKRRGDIYGG